MQIKATWGFKGDPAAVGNEDGRVLSGSVLTVDDAYGHHLIGANLAKPHGDDSVAAYEARVAFSDAGPEALAKASADLRDREDQLTVLLTDFEARKAALDSATSSLASRESEINTREGALSAREAEIDRREAELAKSTSEGDGRSAGGEEASDSTGAKPGKSPKSTKPAAPDENK